MNKDMNTAFRQAEGALKEAAGKITGNDRMRAQGYGQKEAAKAQHPMGGMKDALRDRNGRSGKF